MAVRAMGNGPDKKNFERTTVIISLPINLNICFGCSKEDGSFEYPQHMF